MPKAWPLLASTLNAQLELSVKHRNNKFIYLHLTDRADTYFGADSALSWYMPPICNASFFPPGSNLAFVNMYDGNFVVRYSCLNHCLKIGKAASGYAFGF